MLSSIDSNCEQVFYWQHHPCLLSWNHIILICKEENQQVIRNKNMFVLYDSCPNATVKVHGWQDLSAFATNSTKSIWTRTNRVPARLHMAGVHNPGRKVRKSKRESENNPSNKETALKELPLDVAVHEPSVALFAAQVEKPWSEDWYRNRRIFVRLGLASVMRWKGTTPVWIKRFLTSQSGWVFGDEPGGRWLDDGSSLAIWI